jgi:hypothetical protein
MDVACEELCGCKSVQRRDSGLYVYVDVQLGDEHMQHLSKVRGRLAAEKDAQRKVHVEEVQRLQDKHEADLAK